MEVTLEFGQTGISSIVTTLRETVVVAASGEELFRVSGSPHPPQLSAFLNVTSSDVPPSDVPSTDVPSTPKTKTTDVHDVRSYPLLQGRTGVDAFLKAELSLEEAELKQLHRRDVDLRFRSVEDELEPWLSFCLEDIRMSRAYAARLLMKKPSILDISYTDVMQPVCSYFLEDLRIAPDRFFRLLIRRPALLNKSIERDLRPKVEFLKSLTGLDSKGAGRLLIGCSRLLSSNEAEIRIRMEHLRSQLRLNILECRRLLLRFPWLLSMRSETLAQKVSYFTKTLDRKLDELVAFPSCLSFSLENRVRKRFADLEVSGIAHTDFSLSKILKSPEKRFQRMIERERQQRNAELLSPIEECVGSVEE